jgi:uncharacterized protein DUF2017
VSARFRRRRNGVRLRLSAVEVDVLRDLPEQLRVVYDEQPGSDPARDRIFPRAYLDPTEESAEQEWQELVYPELLRERVGALERVTGQLGEGDAAVDLLLTDDDVQAWLGVLNDLRLVLGTRIGVTDDPDDPIPDLQPDDPRAALWIAYSWLTQLQGELISVLLEG